MEERRSPKPDVACSNRATPANIESGLQLTYNDLETMTKTCPRCEGVFDLEEFGRRSKRGKVVPQPYCPECTKLYRREHYRDNPDAYKRRARISGPLCRKRNREFLASYLGCHPCVDCGETDIRVLQFDHVRGKKISGVCRLIGDSLEKIKKEIEKCEIRCVNCHTIVTGERAKVWWTKLEQFSN